MCAVPCKQAGCPSSKCPCFVHFFQCLSRKPLSPTQFLCIRPDWLRLGSSHCPAQGPVLLSYYPAVASLTTHRMASAAQQLTPEHLLRCVRCQCLLWIEGYLNFKNKITWKMLCTEFLNTSFIDFTEQLHARTVLISADDIKTSNRVCETCPVHTPAPKSSES